MTTNPEYIQTQEVLWKASLVAQDTSGNEHERGIKLFATSITAATQKAVEIGSVMAQNEEWARWMIYDVGIIPDDCFN